MRSTWAAVLAGFATAGCNMALHLTPHRIEIQQGNFVTQEMVAKLAPGMTREQVKFVLGSPLVTDVFHNNRWDYVFFRLRENASVAEQRRLAVFFDNGVLARVDGDVVPPRAAQEGSR